MHVISQSVRIVSLLAAMRSHIIWEVPLLVVLFNVSIEKPINMYEIIVINEERRAMFISVKS